MSVKSEFGVANTQQRNYISPKSWVIAHLAHYKFMLLSFACLALLTNVCYALIPVLIGVAFTAVIQQQIGQLGPIALSLLGLALAQALLELGSGLLSDVISKRFSKDVRNELYINLLGKSQTFHNRQRVGDIMACATGDVRQLSNLVSPAGDSIFLSFSSLLVTLIFIGFIQAQLLLIPVLYTIAFLFALRDYSRRLTPVALKMRMELGETSAVCNEAVAGIEVIKVTAQEGQEIHKFTRHIRRYRDLFIENGKVEGQYLPILLLGIALALALLHGLYLLSQHQLALGQLIAFMGLMANLRSLTSMSFWTFGLVQQGIGGAKRVLALMRDESYLEEKEGGYAEKMGGAITFEHVTFGYGETSVLQDVSFQVRPGQVIAIVGQIGSGKSSLMKLVNRIYDVNDGRVLIDGVDVRDWNLDALRSQISTIEQDVFLFSRSIAENIAYGLGQKANSAAIEAAARDAQAHEFIQSFPMGYETEVGERGMTLSGGQRQRLAIARALLTDPRILILDDATSAIDSATEDEMQKALQRVQQNRTTLMITHRLAQIRRADSILVLDEGRVLDQGSHEELMARCELYQRLFPHREARLPLAVVSNS